MNTYDLDAVLLAAGGSSRMGECKPLLPLWGKTVFQVALEVAAGLCNRVILVTGNRGEELENAVITLQKLHTSSVMCIRNHNWQKGMLSSLQIALPCIQSQAFFVALADMPFITTTHYMLLTEAFAKNTAMQSSKEPHLAPGFRAVWQGRFGHPVLLPSSWIPEILRLHPEEKMSNFMKTKTVMQIETDAACLKDIDTREDYEAALACKKNS